MDFTPVPYVKAPSIAAAWPRALRTIVATGRLEGEVVDQRGDRTYEVEGLYIEITDPLRGMIPKLPKSPGVTAWGSGAVLEEYFETEILGSRPKPEGFRYVYADYIAPCIADVIELLEVTPESRRAIIPVGGYRDVYRDDPPCLRSVQFLIRGGKLDMITTWRSRDYAGAAATNMYGLVRLQETVAKTLEIPVGTYRDFSASAHIRIGKSGNKNDHGDLDWVEKVI